MNKFSLWCDFIERGFLENGFQEGIQKGHFSGATSNPAIFANALKNPAYVQEIQKLKAQKLRSKAIYEILACEDIKSASQQLMALYKQDSSQGFISLEIDPFLSEDAGKSIDEGRRLYQSLKAENVMIKVPATQAGYEIMQALMQDGIAINATLIFSKQQALQCAQAFESARKKRKEKNLKRDIQGVISVFVSRFDRAVDDKMPSSMRAQLGVANALLCYEALEQRGEMSTRTLFASTGVKNMGDGGDLAKDYYIRALKLPHSINTAPLETIQAHFTHQQNLQDGMLNAKEAIKNAKQTIQAIQAQNIDIPSLCDRLLQEGLDSFKASFEGMLGLL